MHLLLLENRQTIQVCSIIKIGRQENGLYPVSSIYWNSPRNPWGADAEPKLKINLIYSCMNLRFGGSNIKMYVDLLL